MSSHFTKTVILVCLLVTSGESKKLDPHVRVQSNLEYGYSSCDPRSDEYCCYIKKCTGSGTYTNKSIRCNQKTHSCTTNETTGYPICVKDEDGGDWVLCQILLMSAWYTYGCVYSDYGVPVECTASLFHCLLFLLWLG